MLPWILALPLWLASCGTDLSTVPAAAQDQVQGQPPVLLHALDDCPSCGILPMPGLYTELFWIWSDALTEEGRAGFQQWTYGQRQVTERGPEVLVLPTQTPVGTRTLSIGCINEHPTLLFLLLPGSVLTEKASASFQSTPAAPLASSATRLDADARCSAAFGLDWHVMAPQVTTGIWVAGQPPSSTEPTW
jgi:hypothetical protein